MKQLRTVRLTRGSIDFWREDEADPWRLSWLPDEGQPEVFSPGEPLPDDYPDPSDLNALIEWGTGRFGP